MLKTKKGELKSREVQRNRCSQNGHPNREYFSRGKHDFVSICKDCHMLVSKVGLINNENMFDEDFELKNQLKEIK